MNQAANACRSIRCRIGFAFVLAGLTSLACTPQPRNFHDCVLKKVTAGMSNEVAKTLVQACRENFPVATFMLDESQLSMVQAERSANALDVYNGSTIHLMGITIRVEGSGREYQLRANIAPNTSESLYPGFFGSDSDRDSKIEIINAWAAGE